LVLKGFVREWKEKVFDCINGRKKDKGYMSSKREREREGERIRLTAQKKGND